MAYFAVYDGHGGTGVANYLKDHCHEFILDQPEYKEGNIEESVLKAFLQVRHQLLILFLEGSQPHKAKGSFNNYVDRILHFFHSHLPLCGQCLYPDLSVDKNRHFLTTSPPYFVHVVIECPLK